MSQTLIFRATSAFVTIACIAGTTFAAGEAATVSQGIKALSGIADGSHVTAVTRTISHRDTEPRGGAIPAAQSVAIRNSLTTSTELVSPDRLEVSFESVANTAEDGSSIPLAKQEIVSDNHNGVLISETDGQINAQVGATPHLERHLLLRETPGKRLADLWNPRTGYNSLEKADKEEWHVEESAQGKSYTLLADGPEPGKKIHRLKAELDRQGRITTIMRLAGKDNPIYSLRVEYGPDGNLASLQEKIYEMDGDTLVLAREIQSRILSVKPQSQPSAPIQPMEILRKHGVQNFANALTGEQKTVN